LLGSYTDAVARFGAYDRWVDGASGELTLVRALNRPAASVRRPCGRCVSPTPTRRPRRSMQEARR
jgi:hypothetical protein